MFCYVFLSIAEQIYVYFVSFCGVLGQDCDVPLEISLYDSKETLYPYIARECLARHNIRAHQTHISEGMYMPL